MEDESHQLDQRQNLICRRANALHQSHSESEKPARFVGDHLKVLFFRWNCHGVAPKEVHPLPTMQAKNLFPKDLKCFGRDIQTRELLLGKKVYVIGRVDRLSGTEHRVRCWSSTPKLRSVLNIVNPISVSIAAGAELKLGRGLTNVQQRSIVKHPNHLVDDAKRYFIHLEPDVEGRQKLGAEVFAWELHQIVERACNDLDNSLIQLHLRSDLLLCALTESLLFFHVSEKISSAQRARKPSVIPFIEYDSRDWIDWSLSAPEEGFIFDTP